MIIFLLIIIAVGVLLLSEPGQALLGLSIVWGIRIFLVLLAGAILIGGYIYFSYENSTSNTTTQSTYTEPSIQQTNQITTNTESSPEKIENLPTYNSNKISSYYNSVKESLPKHSIVCIADKKSVCDGGVCKPTTNTTFNILGSTEYGNFIARCDDRAPCDFYNVTNILKSGDYSDFEIDNPTLSFRTNKTTQGYTETASLGTMQFISSGTCSQYN